MQKIINIDGKDILFKTSGGFFKRYKTQFKRDPISDIFSLVDIQNENGEIDLRNFDVEVLQDICWALAQNADKSIAPPEEWLDQFEEFPIADIIVELMDLIIRSISSSIEPKKNMTRGNLKSF